MKKLPVIYVFLAALLLQGCAASKTPLGQKDTQKPVTSPAEVVEVVEIPQEADENTDILKTNPETHLELMVFKDQAPYYELDFQKIEGGTGNLLLFEENKDPQYPEITGGPKNVEAEPLDSLHGFGCVLNGEEDPADTLTMGFWNRGGAETVLVTLDGLEYEVSLPKPDVKECILNQKIDFEGIHAIIEKADIYPNAILLKLAEIDINHRTGLCFLTWPQAKDILAPKGSAYEEEAGEEYLLYVFDEGIPQDLSFRIGVGTKPSEQVYQDYLLNLD